jgi:hypothetical protein
MDYARSFLYRGSHCVKCLGVAFIILLGAIASGAQTAPPKKSPDEAWVQYLNKYPGLLDESIRLVNKLQHNVQYPAARSESHLLPLLSDLTMYAAIPNYGDAVHQSLTIFNDELQQSEALRNWWQHSEASVFGPKFEDSLEKFSELSQYLGPEIVLSGVIRGKTPHMMIVTQVAKPGLKDFLQQRNKELAGDGGKSTLPLRILEPQDLATVEDSPPATPPGKGSHGPPPTQFFVLVRPDYVVATSDLATLKNFNARVDTKSSGFASTSFGQHIAQTYAGGVTIVGAVDLHTILSQTPQNTKQSQQRFENSGLADMKYFLWERKTTAGEVVSQMELSFTGPRHGGASWLAKPAALGSLDFASPKAKMAGAVILTNPAQIFDNLQTLGGDSNAKAFAALGAFEQAFKLSLKDDFLTQLTGELMVEMVNSTPPNPVWRAVFGVKDANHVQQAFHTLETAMQIPATQSDSGGITYYTVQIPSKTKPSEVAYAFGDGYLIVGSSQDAVADSIRLHKSGESLAKSQRLLEALPPGHESGASALFYQDSVATSALQLQPLAPEYASYLAKLTGQSKAQVFCLYGDEMSIRGASRSSGFDAGAIVLAAAIAIPSALRANTAANEASAVGTMRSVNTAQLTYKASYPQRGYAPDLAALGPNPDTEKVSAEHANLIDETVGNARCTADVWCTKTGYRLIIRSECRKQLCEEYVVVATPVADNTGKRNFCSTSEGLIRFKSGSPITQPVSVTECRSWSPLK